jgi:hypothetical protein
MTARRFMAVILTGFAATTRRTISAEGRKLAELERQLRGDTVRFARGGTCL